ncbi:hypothetical protein G6F43_000962 [Rhizopus delemar]|nr:hypothetical protein G6F43_000962 [Rhizopus delemar]
MLGLLDPQIQQNNLQIRWIRPLLEDNHPQSCSQPILLDHICHFHSGNTGTRLALFFPLLRLRPAAYANDFMQNIDEAVDSFRYAATQQAKWAPAILLCLSLSAIFALIWPHILNQNQPLVEVEDSAFIDVFCSQLQWINYKPKPFWVVSNTATSTIIGNITNTNVQVDTILEMPVSSESRSLWYRLFHRKLYSQSLLSRFDNGLTSS